MFTLGDLQKPAMNQKSNPAEAILAPQTKAILVLGQIALKAMWNALPEEVKAKRPYPKFKHGEVLQLSSSLRLLMSYHPSQHNTFTGRLTESMFDSVFASISRWLKTAVKSNSRE